jgi:hypothetical protein
MTLFTRALTMTLSLLKGAMPDCMTMDVTHLYRTALEGLAQGVLTQTSLGGMGHLVQAASQN